MKVGIDIIETERFASMPPARMEKLFSEYEMSYIKEKNMAIETMAGLYCAKEALFKAIGKGISSPKKLREIEILHDQNGQPYYNPEIQATLSISHTKTTAVAVCIIF